MIGLECLIAVEESDKGMMDGLSPATVKLEGMIRDLSASC